MGNAHSSLPDALKRIRSGDDMVRNESAAELILMGSPAVPAVVSLLDENNPMVRAQAMYVLSKIADPVAASAFQQGLRDSDERVRAHAAVGLAQIKHPDALQAGIQTLNDAPDELHTDMTPAVHALGHMGVSAIPAILEVMLSDDEVTRLRAQRALEMINNRRHGFEIGRGFRNADDENRARREWEANGNYDYADQPAVRIAAVEKWRAWLREQQGDWF